MLELIYPEDYAPEIPARTAADAENGTEMSGGKEYLPVIEESGVVIGMATRQYCHGGAKPLHPVIHLHIIDREGRIYLQKRSMTKEIQPGRWDTAVGGHIDYGESVLEALYRETSEELNFTRYNPIFIRNYVFETQVDREMVCVFAAVGHFGELEPDMSETDGGKWWTQEEIDAVVGKGILTLNFESEYASIKQDLIALL